MKYPGLVSDKQEGEILPYYLDPKNISKKLKDQELWIFQKIIFLWKNNSKNNSIDKNNKELFLFLKDWKHYIYNEDWKNIFLKWINKIRFDSKIYLLEINNQKIISIEYEWKESNYYLENWEQYIKKTKAQKIEEGLKFLTMPRIEGFKQLKEANNTSKIEKKWFNIEDIVEKTKKMSLDILNKILDSINFTSTSK